MGFSSGKAVLVGLMATLVVSGLDSKASTAASDPVVDNSWVFEVGARYWYSTGKSAKNLYNGTGSVLISRLTYDGLTAHSGEGFFRADHNPTNIFIKGYVGGGKITGGSLRDEDFPPVVTPYSDTISKQEKGSLTYFDIDAGYTFFDNRGKSASYNDVNSTKGFRLGGFIGYHYWREDVHALGCQQRATSTICTPTIATNVKVISQDNEWHSLRLGLVGDAQLSERLKFTGEVAYVRAFLDGKDRHHLRPTINPIPEDGTGNGFQIEGVLAYDVTDKFSVGVGGRYWRLGKTKGKSHFEKTPGGGIPQVVNWQTERYGAFVQASLKF